MSTSPIRTTTRDIPTSARMHPSAKTHCPHGRASSGIPSAGLEATVKLVRAAVCSTRRWVHLSGGSSGGHKYKGGHRGPTACGPQMGTDVVSLECHLVWGRGGARRVLG